MSRRTIFFNVAPRYSPGSPGSVSEDIAQRVAGDEHSFYQHALSGMWGEEEKARAERLGLHRIVEERAESGVGWVVLDLITGRSFVAFDQFESGESRSRPVRRNDVLRWRGPNFEECRGKFVRLEREQRLPGPLRKGALRALDDDLLVFEDGSSVRFKDIRQTVGVL